MSEASLRRQPTTALEKDFVLRPEVSSIHLLSGEPVRADLLCFPREYFVARKFMPEWFVVETKHLDVALHESKRLYETAWQTVTYLHTEFRIGDEIIPWQSPYFSKVEWAHITSMQSLTFDSAGNRRAKRNPRCRASTMVRKHSGSSR